MRPIQKKKKDDLCYRIRDGITLLIESTPTEMAQNLFTQEFSDNMVNKTPAKITKNSGKSFTNITFTPDYNLFEMKGLEDDTILQVE